MEIRFYKFHGTGNDFILIDNREGRFQPDVATVEQMCNRRFGIGADGLILLENRKGFDFGMVYFNADGNVGTLCGNGSRCITAFAKYLGIIAGKARFEASDGEHLSEVLSADGDDFMVKVGFRDQKVGEISALGTFIDTGSPHLVRFVPETAKVDVVRDGRRIRNSKKYAQAGVNVDFVEIVKDMIYVRTYERGVEDETWSCGTGVTASALVVASKFVPPRGYYQVQTRGGLLKVSFNQHHDEFTDIWLEGPAKKVFEGTIDL